MKITFLYFSASIAPFLQFNENAVVLKKINTVKATLEI
jgi:hypothetical protein